MKLQKSFHLEKSILPISILKSDQLAKIKNLHNLIRNSIFWETCQIAQTINFNKINFNNSPVPSKTSLQI